MDSESSTGLREEEMPSTPSSVHGDECKSHDPTHTSLSHEFAALQLKQERKKESTRRVGHP